MVFRGEKSLLHRHSDKNGLKDRSNIATRELQLCNSEKRKKRERREEKKTQSSYPETRHYLRISWAPVSCLRVTGQDGGRFFTWFRKRIYKPRPLVQTSLWRSDCQRGRSSSRGHCKREEMGTSGWSVFSATFWNRSNSDHFHRFHFDAMDLILSFL